MPMKPRVFGQNDKHKRESRQTYDRQRGTAHSRGYTAEWAKYSKAYLGENPLCVECEKLGKVEKAVLVDHIRPADEFPALFWEPTNHQGLCRSHHAVKTRREHKR